jgi:hypothetical protein
MDKTYVHFDVHISFDRDLTLAELNLIKAMMSSVVHLLTQHEKGHFDDLDMDVKGEHIA